MIRPMRVSYSPKSFQIWKIGAAIAISGNVEIDRMIARIRNLRLKRRRASA